ncbi:MAG: hypothetical protein NTZ78_11260 [Candidatus Aureabacteria bacterium]|nr:hypothetical protein [Candidatus Auribacterota bacterium]
MKLLVCALMFLICAGCAAMHPYTATQTSFNVCLVKREDKLLAIDGQSRLAEAKGINSQATYNSGKFTGLGGLDKWRYDARFLPAERQGEEYVIVFTAKGPEEIFADPVMVKFEYMYPRGVEVHYSQKEYAQLPRGRHKYVWKNLGTQNEENGDIASWRVSLIYKGNEVASMHSALWRPWGKVVLDE